MTIPQLAFISMILFLILWIRAEVLYTKKAIRIIVMIVFWISSMIFAVSLGEHLGYTALQYNSLLLSELASRSANNDSKAVSFILREYDNLITGEFSTDVPYNSSAAAAKLVNNNFNYPASNSSAAGKKL